MEGEITVAIVVLRRTASAGWCICTICDDARVIRRPTHAMKLRWMGHPTFVLHHRARQRRDEWHPLAGTSYSRRRFRRRSGRGPVDRFPVRFGSACRTPKSRLSLCLGEGRCARRNRPRWKCRSSPRCCRLPRLVGLSWLLGNLGGQDDGALAGAGEDEAECAKGTRLEVGSVAAQAHSEEWCRARQR